VTVEGFPEGGAQFRRPIVIEQAEKLHGEPSGGFAALKGGLKKGGAFRDQDGQATSRGGTQSLAFLFPQGLMVCGFVDEFMPVKGAGVGSDFGYAVEEAHAGDSATELLMRQFYIHLAEREDKASALRQAKLDYLEKMGNLPPIYWAAFVLVGDGSAPVDF
jgi:hypothetical protein